MEEQRCLGGLKWSSGVAELEMSTRVAGYGDRRSKAYKTLLHFIFIREIQRSAQVFSYMSQQCRSFVKKSKFGMV